MRVLGGALYDGDQQDGQRRNRFRFPGISLASKLAYGGIPLEMLEAAGFYG
jgi:hypothetical protein